jgi:transposase
MGDRTVLNHNAFLDRLDGAIVAGGSSAQIARRIGLSEVTVRRRKAALGKAGLLQGTQRTKREVSHATNTP